MHATKTLFLVLCAVVWMGCGDQTLEEVDPEAAPAEPTYTEHIRPIMEIYCTACHAPDAQPGEVEGYGYETCEKVKQNWQTIVETVFENESMPPAGAYRVTSAEQLALQRWNAQGMTCD